MQARSGHDTEPSAIEPVAPLGASSPSSSNPDASGVPGEKFVLALFAALALGVIVAFALFYPNTRPEDRDFIVPATLRDLYLPVVAWGLLTAIDAKRKERTGWWIYLIMSPVPLVNIALNVQWLRKWRRQPGRLGRFEL